MLHQLPMVAFDETGNTGQNLLDPEQPVFVLASVRMADDRAFELAKAAAPPGSAEAKFATLRTSNAGRKRVLSLLRDGAATTDEVRIAIYHKPFLVTTKIVDMLVETWHHEMGVDLYENAANLGLANLLHSVTPVFCGQDAFIEWQRRLIAMVRNTTDANVDAFYTQIQVLRERNTDAEFDGTLAMLGYTRAIVHDGVQNDKAALDPAIPSLVQLASQWTATLGPFDLVHDASNTIARERDELRLLLSLTEEAHVINEMGIAHAFPIQAADIRFLDSRDVPQLQLADLFAGATATLMKARARRESQPFAEELLAAGIANLITGPVWPTTEVTPAGLDAERRSGSKGLNTVVDLIERQRARRTSQ